MGILDGKNILITGVLTDSSIAYHVARLAQEQGANIVLTSFGRTSSITKRIAGRLPVEPPIVQLDVTNKEDLENLSKAVSQHVPHLDGVLHSIAFAPEAALGGNFLNTEWDDVKVALEISAVKISNSRCSLISRFFHSSVNSSRIAIPRILFSIQSSE